MKQWKYVLVRVSKAVEMVEFTTAVRKKAALEARQLAEIEESFVKLNKTQVDLVGS